MSYSTHSPIWSLLAKAGVEAIVRLCLEVSAFLRLCENTLMEAQAPWFARERRFASAFLNN